MIPRLLALLLLLAFALTGCRDALVDPPLDPAPDPGTTPPAALPSPYFKGSDQIRVGEAHHFRVEYVEGAASYRWSVSASDDVRLEGTYAPDRHGLKRLLDARALGPGRIVFTVSVFDSEDVKIAEATKRVDVLEE